MIPIIPQPPHYLHSEYFLSFMDAKCHQFMEIPDAEGLIIAQKVYVGQSSPFEPGPSIYFAQHGRGGVSLEAAAKTGFSNGGSAGTGMADADERVKFENNALRTMIRVEWPGYPSFGVPIAIEQKIQGESYPITKAKLAEAVAKSVKKFYEENRTFCVPANLSRWSLENIIFSQLVLYELRHVSKGSYQPVLLARF